MKNQWNKRAAQESPYYTVSDGQFTTRVLRVYSDPRKPFARALCYVTGAQVADMGDNYCNMIPGLVEAWLAAHPEATREPEARPDPKPARGIKGTVSILITVDGKPVESLAIPATLYGSLSIHRPVLSEAKHPGWNVTHNPTGKRVFNFPTKAQAIRFAKRFGNDRHWALPEAKLAKQKGFYLELCRFRDASGRVALSLCAGMLSLSLVLLVLFYLVLPAMIAGRI